jgi:hypothetical protein
MFFPFWRLLTASRSIAKKSDRRQRATTRLRVDELEDRTVLAVLTVNSALATANATDAFLTLPEAIAIVDSSTLPTGLSAQILSQINGTLHVPSDTIQFDPSLANSTIVLNGAPLQLSLSSSTAAITIDGGTNHIAVSGNGASGVFVIANGANVTLKGLSIKQGTGFSIATYSYINAYSGNLSIGVQVGGGILNQGTLTATNDVIAGNQAAAGGGGIYNSGTLSLDNCSVSGNTDTGYLMRNNDVFNAQTNVVTVTYTPVGGDGGGIFNSGRLTMSDSSVSFNTALPNNYQSQYAAGSGGAIFNMGTLAASNSTLYSNSAGGYGGGIANEGGVAGLGNVTLTNNYVFGDLAPGTFPGGGGIFSSPTGTLVLRNTIVAQNTVSAVAGPVTTSTAPTPGIDPDVDGDVSSGNNNLIGNGSGLYGLASTNGNLIGPKAPLDLAPLADSGGDTQTVTLLKGSPAIGTGGAVATLANGIDASTTNIVVDDALAIAAPSVITIGTEQMLVTNVLLNNDLIVIRGYNETTASIHYGDTSIYLTKDQRGATRGTPPDIGAFAYLSAPLPDMPVLDPSVNAGQRVTLYASAFGNPHPATQWQVSTNGGQRYHNIPSEYSDTLSFIAEPGENEYYYRAVFSNRLGQAESNSAEVFVQYAAIIATQPTSKVVLVGQTVTFAATANANPYATVQWQVSSDGGKIFSNISGANSTELTFVAELKDNDELYRAVFTNSLGHSTTKAVKLSVASL